ncbi:hypothetical protein EP47_05470 [Legionella norrlandica]|uniref:Uncharacterized protein n=1 Tax=Legionella norrlandica TaxID=1498499 RepID=A0A0A2SVV4_9GAMM|nr:hypothetical protein [Legionella norrlandica]KGP63569.1 hypothetical protein EP47_05470 [Legionella norrlandica]
MDVSNKKIGNSSHSLRSHIITALLSMGAAGTIVWLASGMTLVTVLANSFNLGFYIGFMLLMSAASAVLTSPIILPGLLLAASGLLLGAAVVTLAFKLKNAFNTAPSQLNNGLNEEFNLEDKPDLQKNHEDLNDHSNNLRNSNASSKGKKVDLIRFWGSLSLTSLVSSGATALLGWFATDLVISLSIIPAFLLGMTLAIVLVPLSIALSGVFALPAFTALMFALGGFVTGAAVTTFATYFLSDEPIVAHGDVSVLNVSMDNPEKEDSHQKMLISLKNDKSNNKDFKNPGLSGQRSVVPKVTQERNEIKTEDTDPTEQYSFCGLRF